MTGPSRRLRSVLVAAVVLVVLGALAVLMRPGAPDHSAPAAATATPAATTSRTAAAPPPAPAADARPSPRTDEVTALLRERAAALRDGDLATFLRGIDPSADPAFRAAQRALFDNLRGVPLADWSYQLTPGQGVDTRKLPRTGNADELWAPKVVLQYALAGADPRLTSRPMGYLFARHGDSWYLTSDTALAGLGATTWRGPWDFGPCRTLRTASGLVLYHPDGEPTARRIAGQLDADVAGVTAVWGPGWPRTVVVFVPDSQNELRALVGPEFAADSIAAVAVADFSDPAHHVAAGQRVVLNPQGAANLSDTALSVVLRHEITHIAARSVTADGAPMWLLEGFADYVGYAGSGVPMARAAPDLAAAVRAGAPPAGLPADADFRADAGKIDLAYQQAWSVNTYLAQRFGQPALVKLYLTIASQGHVTPQRLDQLLHQSLGIGTSQLVTGWQGYLRTAFG